VALYSDGDKERILKDQGEKEAEPYRTPWRRDYARLIHSPCFRRLQGKTQVFPGNESDFYRNRLTHSLEVAQIAKSIAIRLNATAMPFKRSKAFNIEPDVAEFAGLAHDLGHPPFGHNGEKALDECMRNHGGFEGNAQTLRIVAHLEKKATFRSPDGDFIPIASDHRDLRCGLNLTFRSLAALLKYDQLIPERSSDRKEPGVMKGYYAEEADLVRTIKEHVLGTDEFTGKFKTIECSIMDIADDIAYSTYDLEDNFKAGLLTPMGLFALDDEIYDSVAKTICKRGKEQYGEEQYGKEIARIGEINGDFIKKVLYLIFENRLFEVDSWNIDVVRARDMGWSAKLSLIAARVQALSHKLACNGYHRVKFTSALVQDFLSDIEVVPDTQYHQLYQIRLKFDTFICVEVLKNITYYAIIRSPSLQVVEYRGKDIIKAIFRAIAKKDGTRLLPPDFQVICKGAPEMMKMRAICDFIAGMTDRYAFEFYGRLYGTNQLTIHKPL
jgi:dGTPase